MGCRKTCAPDALLEVSLQLADQLFLILSPVEVRARGLSICCPVQSVVTTPICVAVGLLGKQGLLVDLTFG